MMKLTPTQRDIYLEGKFFGGVVNNIGGYQKYFCDLDIPRYACARKLILGGNDAYRLRFKEESGGCVPLLAEARCSELRVIDYSGEVDAQACASAWIQTRFETPFHDLSDEVFEDALLKIGPEEYWYFAKAHHLIMDGWGFALQMRRFVEQYERLGVEGTKLVSYASFVDHMDRQARYLASKAYADDMEYWLGRHVAPETFAFPPRQVIAEGVAHSQRVSVTIDRSLFRALGDLASHAGANIVSIFHAVLYVYFSRVYHANDIVIGSPLHNRRGASEKSVIGSFVNVTACRITANRGESFVDLLRRVACNQKTDLRHGRFPIGDLVRAWRDHDVGRDSHAYQIAFNYQRLDFDLVVDKRPVETHYLSHHHERTPATFVVCEYGAGQDIALHLDYNDDYFDEDEALRVLHRMSGLLAQVAENQGQAIGSLELLTSAERHRQFVEWNDTCYRPAAPACVDHAFERQAEETPDDVAIAWQGRSLTYRQLSEQANTVAHHLLTMGVVPEQFVVVFLGRTPSMVVALLAILKAGACYVPIDPTYPTERINYILEDSAASVVLTEAKTQDGVVGGFTKVNIDGLLADAKIPAACRANLVRAGRSPSQLAYVIYTSGSTGRPKGVMIEHRNAMAMIEWASRYYTRDDLRAVLAATSICFDLSVFEIFVPLATGGTVVLAENVLALKNGLDCDVTLINTVPSAIRSLLDTASIPASVRCINLAGELLRQELVDAIYAEHDVKVFDLYGPSEDTTYSTCVLRRRNGRETIGRPIDHTRAFVFDDYGDPLPTGIVGELCLAGAGLARGYLNQPVLTEDRFRFNPHAGARVYCTGDLVRWTHDGELQYVGRKDHQVKIRGFRIEPDEIEASIMRHPLVRACVVVAWEDLANASGRALAAYLVPRSRAPAETRVDADEQLVNSIKDLVAAALPVYMMPAVFVCLDELPLTRNGKVDRTALPMAFKRRASVSDSASPRTGTQVRIARLWQEILSVESPGIDDSFFKLGGDSLRFMTLLARLETEFGYDIDMSSLFAHVTIEAQSRLLDTHAETAALLSRISFPGEASSASHVDL